VTCLSVVEHGVPLERMAAEVDRLLRPGGLFVFTTDFDSTGVPHEIDPSFKVFGQAWQVFTLEGLDGLIDHFRRRGFAMFDPSRVSLEHDQRPVRWKGQEYTFALVTLQKNAADARAPAV
jgi:hypothetical protein